MKSAQIEAKNAFFPAHYIKSQTNQRIPSIHSDFMVNKERGFFFLSISECNNHEVKYSDGSNVEPICKILHTPTNSNFWHVSLRWFHNGQDISDLEEKKRRKPEIKRILTAAKAFIQEKGTFDIPPYQTVDVSIYT